MIEQKRDGNYHGRNNSGSIPKHMCTVYTLFKIETPYYGYPCYCLLSLCSGEIEKFLLHDAFYLAQQKQRPVGHMVSGLELLIRERQKFSLVCNILYSLLFFCPSDVPPMWAIGGFSEQHMHKHLVYNRYFIDLFFLYARKGFGQRSFARGSREPFIGLEKGRH